MRNPGILALAALAAACSGSPASHPDGGDGGLPAAVCTPRCGVDLACLAGQCVPKTCAQSADCAPGDICQSGYCSSGQCTPPCAGGQVCSAGSCVNENPCGPHETVCGGGAAAYCANLDQDAVNCGACGQVCPSGEACARGQCAPSCLGNETLCGSLCVDTQSDGQNCGACGQGCDAGTLCSGGTCAADCGGLYATKCGTAQATYCADIDNSPFDCGGCGTTCGSGTYCSQGICQARCGGLASEVCGGICVDLQTDLENCGACAHPCTSGQVCYGGECVSTCGFPTVTCFTGKSGRCADLFEDSQNCGACGLACAPGQVCSDGLCAATCGGAAGTLCTGVCVHLETDNQNCGSCGAYCPAGTLCDGFGQCAATCGAGFTECGSGPAAYCADTTSDPANCGACGSSCGPGGSCAGGSCVADGGMPPPDGGTSDAGSCPPGFVPAASGCVSQSCAGIACPPGFACQDGGCAQPSCAGVTCPSGQRCGNGQCYATGCGGHDCDGGLCWNGACVESDCAGVTCAGGQQLCSLGQCRPVCGNGCSPPEVCLGGACEPGCFVDGGLYAAGTIDPSNLCQICDPSADPGGWTPLLAGNSCGSAEVCAEGTCVSGCSIDGVGYPAGASGSNPCLVCDPAVSPASWTPGANDAPCGSASFCRGGACVRGCEVGGAFVAAGAVAPTDPCASCLPEESSTSYSFSPDGTACSDGQGGTFCESGQCAPVCVVDGGAFTAGSADPAAACFACQPASNPFAFTAITGAVPPGGCPSKEDVCLSGSCAEGCFINGGYLPSGSLAAGGADAGELCCSPLYSTAGWTPQWAELSVGGGAGLTGVFPAQLASGPGVITANESAQTVTLLPSLGNGLLGPGTTYAAGHAVQVAGVGDMDGDGVPDIVVSGSTYYYSNYVTVLPGVDGGGVGAPVTSALGNTNLIGVVPHFFPTAPRAAALFFGWDANNFPLDVVALTDAGYGVVQTTHVGFFVDNARAGQQVVIADFNGDGFEDLGVTSNAYVQDVAVLLSSGTGSLGGEVDFLSGHDAEGLGAGSIFGSHYASGAPVLDLVTYDGTTGAFVVFRNDGNGNFTQWASTAIAGIPSVVSMAAGDFNGDGWGDAAALIGTNPYTVQIFLGDGSGTFTPGPTFSTQINSSSYAGGMAMLGGQYGPGGGDAFFSITSNSGASMWQDACR